ncbi:hypothetical protein P171DRAFT_434800 [Karstenula rhodostoma CBS 690.94]|uniref:Uncharacterized protein n=1 Tax=Karstenula rhodostoma CBS 690.94 TaxID=1392251 RepID=A0A9P4PDS5_9PLEO|nr:hypothetical protein P171DRAFT_434800 [Karstenula rhodostoma CBS 690.94]
MHPIEDDIMSGSDYTAISSFYHPKPTVIDISELPDINMYAYNPAHADDEYDFKTSQEHSKATRRYSNTPQRDFLPAAPQLSPFPSFKDPSSQPPSLSDGSASPVFDRPRTPEYVPTNPAVMHSERHNVDQAPQNLGWEDFRSSCVSFDVNRNASPETLHTPWPKSDKQIPPLAPQPQIRPDAAQEKKNKHVQPPAAKKTTKSRKHSDMETLMKVHKFGKKLQVVYHQGPKGEGQKMWNGIRRINKEKRELKPTETSLKVPWAVRSPRTQAARTQAQKEQLNSMHAAALAMPVPKAPLISPPLQSLPRPPVPTRPAPLGVLRSPVIHKPLPGFFPKESGGSEELQGKVSTTSTYTYHSWDVPITASRSVQYDSRENVVDYPQTKPFVPKLDPAPKPRAIQKKGLPPRPVPRLGEQEPPELAEQENMYRRRVGKSPPRAGVDDLPSAPKPPVGSKFSTLKNKPPAGSTLADKARAKHQQKLNQQKLKEHISGPRPVVAPGGFTTNISTEAGGVGGPAAVVAVAPRIPNPAFIQGKDKAKKHADDAGKLAASTKLGFWDAVYVKDDGKNAARLAPPPPPIPPLPAEYNVPGAHNDKGKGRKKDKKANWTAHVPNPFSLSRRDSDASMVCADARMVSREHDSQAQQVSQSQKGKQKAEEGPGVGLDMRVFKGPVRQFPEQQIREVRDPGPSRQGEWQWEVEDDRLVPEPLGVRKGTGESFYPKYESLIREYGGPVDKGGNDESVWF